ARKTRRPPSTGTRPWAPRRTRYDNRPAGAGQDGAMLDPHRDARAGRPAGRDGLAATMPTRMKPAELFPVLASDLADVDAVIRARLRSDVPLINTISEYIIGAGGKRMRPVMVLLTARALGYQGRDHHLLAAAVESIHPATLLHDAVVAESSLRRGRDTANAAFGNAASVRVGDFLYSRAFQLM